MSTITVTREQMYHGFAWKWWYYATGPDGTEFTNDSIVTLRKLLKRRYPEALVIEPWKAN